MHVDEVFCHGENGGAPWETSHRGCIMRKVVVKKLLPEEGLTFFWTLLLLTAAALGQKESQVHKFAISELVGP